MVQIYPIKNMLIEMDEIRLFSYKMTHDSGFAPCPFGGMLTLATCKPMIRKSKKIGDWIAGFTSNKLNGDLVGNERLIYLMKVTAKVNFQEYWYNPKYHSRKPYLDSGNLMGKIGDNIYKPLVKNPKTIDDFKQVLNPHHKKKWQKERDLSGLYVLISEKFYYFGSCPLTVSPDIRPKTPKGQTSQGVRTYDDNRTKGFIEYVENNYQQGIHSCPHKWCQNDTSWKDDENYIEQKRI